MNSNDKDNNIVNNMASTLLNPNPSNELSRYYGTVAVAGAALLGGALYYYFNQKAQPASYASPTLIDYKNQTREVKNGDGARINSIALTDKPLTCFYEDGRTLYELFLKAQKVSNNGDYLGWKPSPNEPYKWLKYSECAKAAEHFGSGLIELGLEPAKETFIGIYARNRPEWVLTDVACHTYSYINVPLYDTLGLEAISFILLQTQLRLVVCDDSEKAIQIMNTKSSLEYVIIIEKITDEARAKAAEVNMKVFSFDDVKEIGKKNLKAPIPPSKDDLSTICYTSGTTGAPKGAMITHGNVVSIASSMLVYIKNSGLVKEGQERYISYLPLAHMFERVCQTVVLSLGGSIGFYQGDVKKLVDDIKEVQPTIFCTVPRLLNRIYSKITENLDNASALKKAIFKVAFAQKEKEVMKGIVRSDGMFDFAFKQIRQSLGGKAKFIISGSAPISPEVLHFLRIVCGCHVLEGYGATETGGACGVQVPGETTVGNVGPPFLCSLYKLGDVPEMDLVSKRDNKGEILIAGANIFKGYYKDEEKTKAALDSDGWYHTGDIGSFADNGTLKIVDRVKNIFKLQQGEYIAPEKIENLYVRSKYVAQVFVYGNSYKSTLVSVIVPEQTVIEEWARENNLELNMEKLCANKELKKVILADITKIGKEGGLKGFELAKDVYLHHDLFSVENGLLTPTMKSKRNEMQKYFKSQIDEMYKNSD